MLLIDNCNVAVRVFFFFFAAVLLSPCCISAFIVFQVSGRSQQDHKHGEKPHRDPQLSNSAASVPKIYFPA